MTKPSPEVMAAFDVAVLKQLKANNRSGWTTPDSVAVMEAICDVAYSTGEGFDVIRGYMTDLGNASGFRIKLEKRHEANNDDQFSVIPTGRKKGAASYAMAELGKHLPTA